MTVVEIAFYLLCAALTLGGGLITVGSRRPIRSAMGLLTSILGVCGCYLLLNAQFLATIQLIVYAGAVVVLFIFVVMLLGSAATTPSDAGSAVPRYLGAGVFLLAAFGGLAMVLTGSSAEAKDVPEIADTFGTIEMIGKEIFTNKLVPFELTGALLLVAVVGAVAVARGKQVDPTARKLGSTKLDDKEGTAS